MRPLPLQVLDKMIEKGLIEAPSQEVEVKIRFPNNSHIPPPVLAFKEVSFAYDGDKDNLLLKNMDFGIDMDSRIVLVGPNGAGKSTLQKVRTPLVTPNCCTPLSLLYSLSVTTYSGVIVRPSSLLFVAAHGWRTGCDTGYGCKARQTPDCSVQPAQVRTAAVLFSFPLQLCRDGIIISLCLTSPQSPTRCSRTDVAFCALISEEILDVEMSPLDWIGKEFPEPRTDVTEWRKRLGRYGISGKAQTRPIDTMSDGQKTQLVFAWLAQQNPHLLLFDEPTNHLDMESIDGLAVSLHAR